MHGNSLQVFSNQTDIHPNLEKTIAHHKTSAYKRPYSDHTVKAFQEIISIWEQHSGIVILDSCCGTGSSSVYFANKNPESLVIGIDKSPVRLKRGLHHPAVIPDNLILVQANVIDFWRLALENQMRVDYHYLLYPNPWPKKKHFKRRFHAHPVFPDFIKLCRNIEIRSNWEIYIREFSLAIEIITGEKYTFESFIPENYISDFEKKYKNSGHLLYKLFYKNNEKII